MKPCNLDTFTCNPFASFGQVTPLCTAAKPDGSFNTMTIGWGSLGVMWGKKAATVVIRPQRYTHEFMEASDLFTISFFGPQWQEAMAFCGTKSGRDVDKAKECGLTPVTLEGGVGFAQAKLVLVCKKLYVQRMEEGCFTDPQMAQRWYPQKDYHDTYIGEIIAAYEEE